MSNLKTARNIFETAMTACDASPSDYSFQELKDNIKSVCEDINNGEVDFNLEIEGGEVRIIREDSIDAIQVEELEGDTYILGCFDADFIANVTNIPLEMITACQESEVFDAVGKAIVSLGFVDDLQQAYVNADGYGHHFAGYDCEQHNTGDFLIFRVS